jgi:hypothetical protein
MSSTNTLAHPSDPVGRSRAARPTKSLRASAETNAAFGPGKAEIQPFDQAKKAKKWVTLPWPTRGARGHGTEQHPLACHWFVRSGRAPAGKNLSHTRHVAFLHGMRERVAPHHGTTATKNATTPQGA